MKITSNTYKKHRFKDVLKSNQFLILCNYSLYDNAKWLKIEQSLKKKNCSFYRLNNSLTKKVLKNTIYYHLNTVLSGNILIIKTKDIQSVDFILKNFPVYLVKKSDKLYTFNQLSTLKSANLPTNIKYLNNNLNIVTKKLSVCLNKIKDLSE